MSSDRYKRDDGLSEKLSTMSRRDVARHAVTASLATLPASAAASQPLGAPALMLAHSVEQGIRTDYYGIRADGRTDDTTAWRNAYADLSERGVGRLIFSGRGRSLVSAPIIDGHAMLPGITLVGEGRASNNDYVHDGPSIVYTSTSGALFDVRQAHGAFGAAEQGRWTFRNLSFIATEPNGSLFAFQNPDGYAAKDGADGWSYLSQIRFENCHLRGSMSTALTRLGDAIKATKTFYLWLDPTTVVEGFRYGLRLEGCDNSLIQARMVANACHVKIGRGDGWFGNNNRIAAPFLGPIIPTHDVAHHVDDEGRATIIDGTLFEQDDAAAIRGSFLRIAGDMCDYREARFSSADGRLPMFTLAPDARECILRPRITAPRAASAPTIEAPSSWDFGQTTSDHRLRVIGAGRDARALIGNHPRLWYGEDPPLPYVVSPNSDRIVDVRGSRPRTRFFDAQHYWALNYGSVAAAGSVSVPVRDKWIVRLDGNVAQCGINLPMREGIDFVAGDRIEAVVRLRVANGRGWAMVWTRGGKFAGNAADLAQVGDGWTLARGSLATAGWAAGEEMSLLIYDHGQSGGNLDIDAVSFTFQPDA